MATTVTPWDQRVAELLADRPAQVGQAQRMADLIRTGQLDTRNLTVDLWDQLLDSLDQMIEDKPDADWSAALNRYVRPLLGSNLPATLQGKAARVLSRAMGPGRVDSGLVQWIQSPVGSRSLLGQRVNLLQQLLQEQAEDPLVQQAYTILMSRYAPSGRLTSAYYGPQGAAWLADLYRTAVESAMPPEAWASLPRIDIPDNARNLPLAWRRLAENLAEWELGRHGYVVTPTGFAEAPTMVAGDLIGRAGISFAQMLADALLRQQDEDPFRRAAENMVGSYNLTPLSQPVAPPPAAPSAPAPTRQDVTGGLAIIQSLLAQAGEIDRNAEQIFQQIVRPELERLADRRTLRALLAEMPWSELLKMFGGSSRLYNRVMQWLTTGH